MVKVTRKKKTTKKLDFWQRVARGLKKFAKSPWSK